MSRTPNDFDPNEFLNRSWHVFDGDAGGGYGRGVVTFTKDGDRTFNLLVDGEVKAGPFDYRPRTRTLALANGTRAISFWDGDPGAGIPDRIFGARKGVSEDDLLPFEKGDRGSWGAEGG